jgi:hypothetical protein
MARRKMQWHPLFAQLLRPHVERYYEVRTNVPVGDLPREADIVLLRRRGIGPLPFTGLWRELATWNVLEFKGPTVTPRPRDLALLLEVGLGIARRLNTERPRPLPEREVAFWYLANRLGDRFREDAERRLGRLEAVGTGIWRAYVLGHPCLLVSTVDLPVDEDSLPLHVIGAEPESLERKVGEYVAGEHKRLSAYGDVFAALHPRTWKELQAMAKSRREKLEFDIRPAVELLGLPEVIRQIGLDELLKQAKARDIVAHLPRAKREELKRLLEVPEGETR